MAEMEGSEADAMSRATFAEVLHQPLHFAVLAFLQAYRCQTWEPLARSILALTSHVTDASMVTPLARPSRSFCVTWPNAHAIAPHPACAAVRAARHLAVIGEEQEAFGIDVEAADRDDARHSGRQMREHGWAPFGIAM